MEYLNIIPEEKEGYRVTHQPELLRIAKELSAICDKNNLWTTTHNYRKDYLRGDLLRERKWDEMDPDFANKLREYASVMGAEGIIESVKIEVIDAPDKSLWHQHDKVTRLKGVSPGMPELQNKEQVYWSSLWHVDAGAPTNNHVTLLYMNDVDTNQGPFNLAWPQQRCVWDRTNKEVRYNGETLSTEIPRKEFTGPAGTMVSFHSFSLHRGNTPIVGKREALLVSLCPPGDEYHMDLMRLEAI